MKRVALALVGIAACRDGATKPTSGANAGDDAGVSASANANANASASASADAGADASASGEDASARRMKSAGAWGTVDAPASLDSPRPVVLYLHGMWASPEDSCPLLAHAATAHGFLVCPRGNARMGDGSWFWSGNAQTIASRLDAALAEADALAPGNVAHDGGTIVGFSNGAAFAVRVALAQPGRYTSLVLMAMNVSLDPKKLEGAGVKRVLLGAGDLDGSRVAMEREAKKLAAAGFAARYVSLGKVGHAFARDMDAWMRDALAWVRE